MELTPSNKANNEIAIMIDKTKSSEESVSTKQTNTIVIKNGILGSILTLVVVLISFPIIIIIVLLSGLFGIISAILSCICGF
jgi:hypothetical protein